ncbi:MAG: glycerol-3-phosphate dehydrogenase C-terminal domain-containing protein, partial [Fidelibacterota bacterium]
GVRPLVAMEGSPSRVSRDTMIHHETDGLVLVAGGKLTAFRAMAEEVVDDVLEIYGSRFKGDLQGCKTDSTRLVGGELEAFDSYRKAVQEILPDSWPNAPKIRDHLVSAYGTRFLSILGYGLENPFSLKPLYSGSEVILGEIRHAVEEEMAVTLDDFMGRRTGLKYFTDDHALPVVSRIARMMGARLGWSFSETRRQIEKYFESVETATTIREGTPTSHDLLETGAV